MLPPSNGLNAATFNQYPITDINGHQKLIIFLHVTEWTPPHSQFFNDEIISDSASMWRAIAASPV